LQLIAVRIAVCLSLALVTEGLAQQENPVAGESDSPPPDPTTEDNNPAAEEETIVKLAAVNWFPQSVDIRPEAEDEVEAKWEVRIPTVQVASPEKRSEVAELRIKAEQEINKAEEGVGTIASTADSLILWSSSQKSIVPRAAKFITRR